MTKLAESAIEDFACNMQILHVAFSGNCPEKSDSWMGQSFRTALTHE